MPILSPLTRQTWTHRLRRRCRPPPPLPSINCSLAAITSTGRRKQCYGRLSSMMTSFMYWQRALECGPTFVAILDDHGGGDSLVFFYEILEVEVKDPTDWITGGEGSWKMMISSIDGGRFISSHIELILRDSLMRPEIPVRIVWQRVTSTNAMNWIISTISTKSLTQLNSGSIRTVSENPDGRIPQRCLGDSNVQISWDLFRIQWDSEGLVWDPIKILPVHTAILQSP